MDIISKELLPMPFYSDSQTKQRVRDWRRKVAIAVLSGVIFFVCLLAYSLLIDDSFLPRRISYDQFALWFKPWRDWPLEDRLYQGTDGLRYRREMESDESDSDVEGISSGTDFPYLSNGAHMVPESIVSCQGIDGFSLPLSPVQDIFENKNYPIPSFGLVELSGTGPDGCLDAGARLLHYGLELPSALNTGENASLAWKRSNVSHLQEACIQANSHRFSDPTEAVGRRKGERLVEGGNPQQRTAVVLRAYDSFRWTNDDLVNARAMISELALWSGGEYQLFILLHVKDAMEIKTMSHEKLKEKYIPEELRGITEVWSYNDCEAAYPAVGEYDVFFHNWMPVQLFSVRHPEFEYVWNWEMDIRSTSHYGMLFAKLVEWAKSQKKSGLDSRNSQLYIPAYHGSYENFVASQDADVMQSMPRTSSASEILVEDVDLLTLFPMFDPAGTKWPWRDYLVHYTTEEAAKIRRAAIGTNHRLSRKMLLTMHNESADGKAMMAEMWPTTLAHWNNLNAVFVPHPVWLERRWPSTELQTVFNSKGGIGLHVGGSRSRKFEGSSWFFNSKLPMKLYSAWIGRSTSGPGSRQWQNEHGPMCLPGMLFHPLKSAKLPG